MTGSQYFKSGLFDPKLPSVQRRQQQRKAGFIGSQLNLTPGHGSVAQYLVGQTKRLFLALILLFKTLKEYLE